MSTVNIQITNGQINVDVDAEANKKATKDITAYSQDVQDLHAKFIKFQGKHAVNNLPHTSEDYAAAKAAADARIADDKTYSFDLHELQLSLKHTRAKYREAVKEALERFQPKELEALPDGTYPERVTKGSFPEWVVERLAKVQGIDNAPHLDSNFHYPRKAIAAMLMEIERCKFEIVRWIADKDLKEAKAKEDAAERGPRQLAGAAKAKQDARLQRQADPEKAHAELEANNQAVLQAKAYMDNLGPEKAAKYANDPAKYATRIADRHRYYFEQAMLAYYTKKLTGNKRAGDESDSDDDENAPLSKRANTGGANTGGAASSSSASP